MLHALSMHKYLSFKKNEANRLDRKLKRTGKRFHQFFSYIDKIRNALFVIKYDLLAIICVNNVVENFY